MTLRFSPNQPRATAGQTYVIDLNWTDSTLTAGDFNFLAALGGGDGPFFAAAHLQEIGPTGALSTWIADGAPPTGDCPGCTPTPNISPVPELGSMLLMGTGLLGLARGREARATTPVAANRKRAGPHERSGPDDPIDRQPERVVCGGIHFYGHLPQRMDELPPKILKVSPSFIYFFFRDRTMTVSPSPSSINVAGSGTASDHRGSC